MAAKFFTGLPLAGPDPECVLGHGATALADVDRSAAPRPDSDHSRPARTLVRLVPHPTARLCESPAGRARLGHLPA